MVVLAVSSRGRAQMRAVEIIPDLHVEDLDKARKFYAEHLGLTMSAAPTQHPVPSVPPSPTMGNT